MTHIAQKHITTQERSTMNNSVIRVGFVGKTGCGKETLFNMVTGGLNAEKNFCTIQDVRRDVTFDFRKIQIQATDFPGITENDLLCPANTELCAFITSESPDVLIQVIDAEHLEDSFDITAELIDHGVQSVIALTNTETARTRGTNINIGLLSSLIGMPIVPVVLTDPDDTARLMEQAIRIARNPHTETRHLHIPFGEDVENTIRELQQLLRLNTGYKKKFQPDGYRCSCFSAIKPRKRQSSFLKIHRRSCRMLQQNVFFSKKRMKARLHPLYTSAAKGLSQVRFKSP